MRRSSMLAGLALLTLGVLSAHAVIIKLVSLKEIFSQSTHIAVAKVDSLTPDRPGMVLTVDGILKGELPVQRLAVNMKGDRFSDKDDHRAKLFKRLAKDLPVLLFVEQKENRLLTFAYTNGTWFTMLGQKDGDSYRWSFLHCEPYFSRTFKGTTAELKKLAQDFLEKKTEPPAPNKDEKPALGPEVKPASGGRKPPESSRKTQGAYAPRSPLFAVIVGLPGAGIIGVLALLFPALFGGVAILLKRWVALVTVVFTTATLFSLWIWFKDDHREAWWASPVVFWNTLIALNLLGILWAWRRHLRALAAENSEPAIPPRTERWTVFILSLLFSGGILWCRLDNQATLDRPVYVFLLVMATGFWAGLVYLLGLQMTRAGSHVVPTEGIILGVMVLAGLLLAPRGSGGSTHLPADRDLTTDTEGGVATPLISEGPSPRRFQKLFEVPGQADIASAPTVAGKRIYLSAIHGGVFERTGAVYCLERETGKSVWEKPFTFDGKMKQPLASPVVVENRILIGEGWHENDGCHLFCINAEDGSLAWKFQTNSHTESTPCVAGDRVFFGAGDDGLYCVNLKTGQKQWQYPDPGDKRNGLHIDTAPVVVGDRVYCASGRSQTFQNFRVACLEAATGKKLWECDQLPQPAWGPPLVARGKVFLGLGNGRLNISDQEPVGAFLCLDAEDGKRLWVVDKEQGLKDAVHTKPVLDAHHVYFGSRDNHAYAVNWKTGRVAWRRDLGSAVVSSPGLASCSWSGRSTSVFFASVEGKLACLDPVNGEEQWPASKGLTELFADLKKVDATLFGGLGVVVQREETGDRREVYFATGVNSNNGAVLFRIEDFWPRP